ncbi:MAG: hypothetical protein FWC38_00575 [Proteobacteria bacterium]|nr:hypothetical protein [Pseudomonadota bacterium]MCL2306736.1 hypothetical protein [Pseudomonadota bacterium]
MLNKDQVALGIHPILSTVVRGYTNHTFVGQHLFPFVPAPAQGKVIKFGKEAFVLYETLRARGADAKRMSVGYEAEPFALELHDLDAKVPKEDKRDAQQFADIDLAKRHVEAAWKALLLGLEHEHAKIARNPDNYHPSNVIALSGSFTNINVRELTEEAKEAVSARIGVNPNVAIVGPGALKAFKNHPTLINAAEKAGKVIVTLEQIREALDIPRVHIGEANYVENIDDPDADFSRIWGSDIVFAYVPDSPAAEMPAYGYTYRQNGRPSVLQPWHDYSARSDIYGVSDERSPQMTSDSAGVLITGITL